jgi:hypothetical protein
MGDGIGGTSKGGLEVESNSCVRGGDQLWCQRWKLVEELKVKTG